MYISLTLDYAVHEINKYGIHSFTQITQAVDKELTYNQLTDRIQLLIGRTKVADN